MSDNSSYLPCAGSGWHHGNSVCSGSSLPQPDSCGVVFAFGTPCTVQASAAGNGFHCFVSVKRRVRVSTKEFSVPLSWDCGEQCISQGHFYLPVFKKNSN